MPAKTLRVTTPAVTYPVPRDRDEANSFVARIGVAQRERTRIEADMNDELAEVKARYEAEAKAHGDVIETLVKGLQTWAEANRETLTKGGKVKYVRLADGEITWRVRPPKVFVRSTALVLETLKRLGLLHMIRVKEEINKDAMLAEPEVAKGVAGVIIGSAGEDFAVKPYETELEEVA